jgi:diguanylate cyclase (GGDEF)-like protein/PAS domain S-box-containing protein
MPTHAESHHPTKAGGQVHAAVTPDAPADIMALYRRIAEHAQIPIAMTTGRAHRLCGANPAFCRLLGAESEALLGQSLIDAVPASDTDRVRALLERVYHTGAASREDSPQPTHSERDQANWNYIAWPILDDQERPAGLMLLIGDATAHHRDEQAVIDTRAINEQLLIAGLREQELAEQLRRQLAFTTATTHSLAEGLIALDRAGRFTMVNPAAEQMLGCMEGELLGRSAHEVIYGQDAARARDMADDSHLLTVMRSGISASDEQAIWMRCDGAVFPTAYSAAPIITDGQVVGAVVAFRDMTEARQVALALAQQTAELARAHAELEQVLVEVQALALTDDLTTLYNRRGFFTLAAQQMKVATRTRHALSLIYIDLDGLKSINDRLGHQAGSQAILTTAHILSATFRDSDIIARLGGDEFVVLAMDSAAQDRDKVLERLQAQCDLHNLQANAPYQISMSIGVAHCTAERPCSLDELLSQADAQMYVHKQTKHTTRAVGSAAAHDQ